MHRSSPIDGISRRGLLTQSALALAAASLTGVMPRGAFAATPDAIRITDGGPGSAGAIWRPLIDAAPPSFPGGAKIEWVNGAPGQVQLQLASGAANISVYGALGAAELALKGGNVVIIGPALNNHGRWIVRDNSGIRSLKDLAGRTIATQHEASDTYRHARLAARLNGFDLKADAKLIFGSPTANIALFERGDVDAVIAIEPTATRLIARGAREIARTGDLWREATGDSAPLFLVGLAADRTWAQANRALIGAYATTLASINRKLRKDPAVLSGLYKEFGIPADEKAAIELLPKRLTDIYGVDWDRPVFANIDRQIDEAVKVGILTKRPDKPVYDTSTNVSG